MFPLGIWHYLIGGLIIGLATLLTFVLYGSRLGASSVLSDAWSFLSQHKTFHSTSNEQRAFRILFAVGIVLGALVWAAVTGDWFITTIPWYQLLLGGILVGYGVRLSNGCTSGHGISGIASLNPASFVAVITFLFVAIITAHIAQLIGVIP